MIKWESWSMPLHFWSKNEPSCHLKSRWTLTIKASLSCPLTFSSSFCSALHNKAFSGGRDTWGVTVAGPGETLAHSKTPPCSLSGAARQTITLPPSPPPPLTRLSVTSPISWQTDLQLQVARGRTGASHHHYYHTQLREQLKNTGGTQSDLFKLLGAGWNRDSALLCVCFEQADLLAQANCKVFFFNNASG